MYIEKCSNSFVAKCNQKKSFFFETRCYKSARIKVYMQLLMFTKRIFYNIIKPTRTKYKNVIKFLFVKEEIFSLVFTTIRIYSKKNVILLSRFFNQSHILYLLRPYFTIIQIFSFYIGTFSRFLLRFMKLCSLTDTLSHVYLPRHNDITTNNPTGNKLSVIRKFLCHQQ